MPIRFHEAIASVLRDVAPLGLERVPLLDALGRTLAVDVIARRSLPPADNSAMDGYALRAADQGRALPVVAVVPAGETAPTPLPPGSAARIFTGAPVPPGADTVVAQECTERDGDVVRVLTPEPLGGNVRRRGEDVDEGALLLRAGTRLGPAHLALLAGQNVVNVSVARRPVVAILATGEEVHEPGEPIPDGHIASSNGVVLAARVLEAGGIPRNLGVARDSPEALAKALRGIDGADVLLTVGGVSVGELDFVKEAIAALGGEQTFWTVRMRPGKPNAYGRIGRTRWFGLPGNPVSCDVSFLMYVRPALLRMQGREECFLPTLDGVLDEPLQKRPGFLLLVRGIHERRDGAVRVRTTGPQGSGIQSSMARATCLVALPEEGADFPAGSTVTIAVLPGDPAQREAGLA